MVLVKLAALVIYAALVYVGASQPLTLAANISLAVLATLGIAHFVECFVYQRLIKEAPGSAAWHTVNVFLFGIFHAAVMRRRIRAAWTP